MLRIVLPAGISTASAPAAWLLRRAVSGPNVVAVATPNVRVTVKIVVIVDVDFVVPAPSGPPAPAAAPERPHHPANTERDRQSRGIISRWRIVNWRVGIDRWAVHHDGIIR